MEDGLSSYILFHAKKIEVFDDFISSEVQSTEITYSLYECGGGVGEVEERTGGVNGGEKMKNKNGYDDSSFFKK